MRIGVIADAARYARPLQRWGAWFDQFGTGTGGMHIGVSGLGKDGKAAHLDWHLTAHRGHGPEIPCVAAIVVARELAAGRITARGASPCMGLMTLAQFSEAVSNLDIAWRTIFR